VSPAVWQITLFTIAAAVGATLLMLVPGVLVAWWLARRSFPGKALVETVVSLPLVLPPVATGLILLKLLGRRGPLAPIIDRLGVDVVFTAKAVVLAMAVMGLPLLVRTVRAGFEQVNRRYEHVAATLGASAARVFFTISLPLARRAVLAGAILGFSRAIGEFGATIVLAGSIPGQTQTLAVAIYTFAESGNDRMAGVLLVVSLAIAFVALWLANRLSH
jgi:molybdate transport system permease protein